MGPFAAAAGGGGGGLSASDSSSTSSGGTFMPTFGAVGVPKNQMATAAVIAAGVLLAILIWKKA